MEYITSAKTVEKAISKALKMYNLTLNEVDVEVVDFGEKKLLFSRPATVKLTYKSNKERLPNTQQFTEADILRDINALQLDMFPVKVDGTVQYVDGKWIVTDPKNDGSFAVIRVPAEVELYIDGKQVNGTTIVTQRQQIQVKTKNKDPVRQVELRVSDDHMSGSINIRYEDGFEYEVENSEPITRMHVSLHKRKRSALRYSLSEISSLIESKGICYGVDWSRLLQIIEEGDGQWHVFAKGTEAIPGENGKLDGLVDFEGDGLEKDLETNVVKIFSVKEGEVLAKILPPTLGKAGVNVFNVAVPASPGKPLGLNTGHGVQWMEEVEAFVSNATGRPSVRNGLIQIVPCHVINEDVYFIDGGLEFQGDVLINGSVYDGVHIRAGGNVTVIGHVYASTIEAQGSIRITKQVVGATIQAGASQVCFVHASHYLAEILRRWEFLMLAVDQLEGIHAFKRQDLAVKGFGQLIKLLLETKFKNITELVLRLQDYYDKNQAVLQESVGTTVSSLSNGLIGYGPLQFDSKLKINAEVERWKEAFDRLSTMIQYKENARIDSAFNSRIEASGDIQIDGWGTENSLIVSGQSIFVQNGHPGTVRGGSIIAKKSVKVNEIGTPGGARTTVELPENGSFEAKFVHTNTRVKLGSVEKVYSEHEDMTYKI